MMADRTLQGSVAVVTGGAQGIGEAICEALLQRAAKVSILDVDEPKGLALADKLKGKYGKRSVHFVICDVTSKSQMEDAFFATKEVFGSIDIVCNNAGVAGKPSANQFKDWNGVKQLVDVNVTGVLLGTYLAIHHMGTSTANGHGGVIINISSSSALFCTEGIPVYAATKHAVMGLTCNMKDLERTEGIRVNCVCPAFTDTRMVRGSFGRADLAVNPTARLARSMGTIRPELVALGVIHLIEDKSKNGAVQLITKRRGIEYAKQSKL